MTSLDKQEALHFACPHCAGNLEYSIGKGKMVCKSCGREYAVTDFRDPSASSVDGKMGVVEYRCPQCGADIHTAQGEPVTHCSFCGSNVVFTQQISRLRRPDLIVPFKITREKCEEIYRKRIRRALFAPKELSRQETIEHFQPVYVPFWRYSATFGGPGTNIYTEKYTQGNYRYEDTYQDDLNLHMKFERAYYDASSVFDDETAIRLCLKARNIQPFHAGFLCGCFSEGADVSDSVYKPAVAQEAKNCLNERLRGSSAYRGSLKYKTQLVLMPVWLLASRQNGRVLYTAINGESGKIVCDTTVSWKRFAALTFLLTLLFLGALLLLSSQVILRPKLAAAFSAVLSTLGFGMLLRNITDTKTRLTSDTDPTRDMIRRWKTKRIMLPIVAFTNQPLWEKLLLPIAYAAVTVVFAVIMMFRSRNMNQFVGAFTADVSAYPALLLVVSFVAMVYLTSKAIKQGYGLLYILELLSQAATFFMMMDPTTREPLYFSSLAMLFFLSVLILAQFRHHNGFVTRPVPFFGGKEK